MSAPQGLAYFPGVNQLLEASIALVHGISRQHAILGASDSCIAASLSLSAGRIFASPASAIGCCIFGAALVSGAGRVSVCTGG